MAMITIRGASMQELATSSYVFDTLIVSSLAQVTVNVDTSLVKTLNLRVNQNAKVVLKLKLKTATTATIERLHVTVAGNAKVLVEEGLVVNEAHIIVRQNGSVILSTAPKDVRTLVKGSMGHVQLGQEEETNVPNIVPVKTNATVKTKKRKRSEE